MDETKELTKDRLDGPVERSRLQEAKSRRLEKLAQGLLLGGNDPHVLGGAALEGILEVMDFERGFIFIGRQDDVGGSEVDPGSFQPLATRARKAGGSGEWGSVRNPDFAVNRSLLKRAALNAEPFAVNDCLVQPTPESEAQHRAVLCQSFDLIPGVRGVLYLDRGLGRGELGDAELDLLKEFSGRCLFTLTRGYAVSELEALRARIQPVGAGEGKQPDVEEAGEGPAIDPEESPSFFGIVGRDEKLEKLFTVVRKVKDSDLSVCIFGESGTGKELLARAIHDAGCRRDQPFVAENCGAIPENLLESELFGHVKGAFTGADEDKKGLFEVASGGTLFLDEIGDMSEGMQRKLLRVLQEGVVRPIGGKQTIKVDVRVICASNRDLKVLVGKGTFRPDLYYRLNVITIEVPALRDRPGDIPLLVSHLAAKICDEEGAAKRFSQSAMKALSQYPWPGNIRELRNVLRRVIITCPRKVIVRKDVIGYLANVSASPRSGENMTRDEEELVLRVPVRESFNEVIEECERVVLLNALKQCAWNKSRVTKALKIPRQSLYNKISKYKLERDWGGGEAGQE